MRCDNLKISVHHVGGRSGSRGFPVLEQFEKDIINAIYDADSDCLEQISQRNINLKSELQVLPYCLSDICKSTYLNISYDPYGSSIKKGNPDYDAFYCFDSEQDYVFLETNKTMERRPVEVVSMDYLFQAEIISTPPPDFLSLDTQGSEYEILQGANEILKSNVLAMVIEVEFHPIYKDQKLFQDITYLLSSHGFYFTKFLDIHEFSPFRAPIGLRGEGFQLGADALFLRKIDCVEALDNNRSDLFIKLQKLAFMSIVFSQFEYGLQCLLRGREQADFDSIMVGSKKPLYMQFLRNLEEKVAAVPPRYPDTFAQKFTFEESKARFDNTANQGFTSKKKEQLRYYSPTLFRLLVKIKRVFTRMHFIKKIFIEGQSDVETLLINYGLKKQAKLLSKNRKIQSMFSKP